MQECYRFASFYPRQFLTSYLYRYVSPLVRLRIQASYIAFPCLFVVFSHYDIPLMTSYPVVLFIQPWP